MIKTLLTVLTALNLLGGSHAFGQYETAGLDLDGDLSEWYDRALGLESAKIFEGSYYDIGSPYVEQNQYFKGGQWATGTVIFDGQKYDNVDMLYNSFQDQLVVRNIALHFSIAQPTLPNQARIDSFQIHGRRFVHLRGEQVPASGEGFYEHLFDGESIDFFVKRIKNEYIKSSELVYEEEDKHFLYYNGQYIKFSGKNSIYKLNPEHKTAMKKAGQKTIIRLRLGEEDDLILLLKQFDQLHSKP
ncbi:MAG: hypothetical protein ABJF11_16700 [Reichenbachiella sp.]|uniref:hypothetical protein n=1 Tax=Reichenbachiella sp. TaxID=2184521 RepID=UPI0032678E00